MIFLFRNMWKSQIKSDKYGRFIGRYMTKEAKIPATNLQTKGDSISFQTPTIEGTIMRRNKLDENSNHPWKAEVNEDDTGVVAGTITGWFTSVYEPAFTVTP